MDPKDRLPIFLVLAALLQAPAAALAPPALGASAADTDPALVGAWSAPIEGEATAITMVLLHDGRVLYWSGHEVQPSDDPLRVDILLEPLLPAQTRIYDPRTGAVTQPHYRFTSHMDIFCAGQVPLADGRILAAGGTRYAPLHAPGGPVAGLREAWVFDPLVDDWVPVSSMADARWYPSVIGDREGRAWAVSGMEVLGDSSTYSVRPEVYDGSDDTWTRAGESERLLPMYPRVTMVPGGPLKGQMFYNAVGDLWGPFGQHPAEAQWALQQAYDPAADAWRFLGPSTLGARHHAASVMLPLRAETGYAPQFLTFGGTLHRAPVATPAAEIADLSTDPPTNHLVAPMNEGRWHVNGVLLPDGTVMAVGGGRTDDTVLLGTASPPVLTGEIYDPEADAWRVTAPMQAPRVYHSTAVLLPDARVLVGGHSTTPLPPKLARDILRPQEQETRLEIFSPPYLFRGARPVIEALGATHVTHGDDLAVRLEDAHDVHSAVLMRPGATTHAFDSAQRAIVLEVSAQAERDLVVRMPPDADVAPPGWYMLFVNGDHPAGPVPSVAAWVHVS